MKRAEDPYAGRVALDWAYSLGCRYVIESGGEGFITQELRDRLSRAQLSAMIDQYRMGQRHERQRIST